jgi:hypothetical protein
VRTGYTQEDCTSPVPTRANAVTNEKVLDISSITIRSWAGIDLTRFTEWYSIFRDEK